MSEALPIAERISPFVRAAFDASQRAQGRANAVRDKVGVLRAQLAAAEGELSTAERESDQAQQFLREVWDHYRSEVGRDS